MPKSIAKGLAHASTQGDPACSTNQGIFSLLRAERYRGRKERSNLRAYDGQDGCRFWLEVDPVEQAATSDVSSIAAALQRCASRGNAAVQTPQRSAFPDWVVLKYRKKKKQRDFEVEYRLLSIEHTEGNAYLIRNHSRSKDLPGYEPESEALLTLRNESTFLEIASALKSITY